MESTASGLSRPFPIPGASGQRRALPERPRAPRGVRALAPAPPSAESLLVRAREGDRQARRALLRRFHRPALRILRIRTDRSVAAGADLERAVTEAFREAWSEAPRFRVREDAGLVERVARLAERRIRAALGPAPPPQRSSARAAAGGDRAETADAIDAAVARLSTRHREVVVFRDLAGGSWPWVAQQLETPSIAAAQELHRRAKLRLAEALAPYPRAGRAACTTQTPARTAAPPATWPAPKRSPTSQ